MSYQEERLKEIADAIREKEGSSEPIPASEFAERVRALKGGAAVDTLDWCWAPGTQPAKGDYLVYEGKTITNYDFPVAYHGGEVKILYDYVPKLTSIKIDGNVLKFGY